MDVKEIQEMYYREMDRVKQEVKELMGNAKYISEG